jgi:hypothetical protein
MKLKLEFEFISMYYYLVISYVEFTVTRLSSACKVYNGT